MFMKRLIFTLLLFNIVHFSCTTVPENLENTGTCDCSAVTQLTQPIPEDAQAGVLEIYDAEMNLVQYSEKIDYSIPADCSVKMIPVDIIWSGHDMNGRPVPLGKYLGKVSIINQCTTMVECRELFVK
jgi:hypothetical protein